MARTNIKDLTNDIMLHTAFDKTSKAQVEDVLRSLFTTIADRVIAGDSVHIPGFGKFECFNLLLLVERNLNSLVLKLSKKLLTLNDHNSSDLLYPNLQD